MIELINFFLNNIISIFFALVILLMVFGGFFWKRKIESETDFIKKVNKRFVLKYVIFFMLIIGMVFVFVSYIFAFIFEQFGKYLILGSLAFLIVSVIWAFIFERINLYTNFSKDKIVNGYISLFAKNKISNFKYVEIITWFSRWNHKNFLSKNNDEKEIDQLITKFELFFRPYDNGLCLAFYHKEEFLILCKAWEKCDFKGKLGEIESTLREMENKAKEEYKFFSLSLDHNILFYLSVIAMHIVASILTCDKNLENAMGNILFYIPNDILIILIYKGVIIEREEHR